MGFWIRPRSVAATVLVGLSLAFSAAGLAHGQAPHPDRVLNAWIARADLMVERGRTRRAAALLRRVIRRDPADARAPLRLLALEVPGTPAAAAAADDSARERARDIGAALEAARVAEGDVEAARELRLARAWAAAVAGDHRDAIERVALGASRLDTASVGSLRDLAALAVRRHDLAAAHDALAAARRIDPVDLGLVREAAAVHLARGRPEEAVGLLMEAVGRRPEDESIQRDLGGALLAAGRAREATEIFATLSMSKPGDAPALLDLARAALESGQAARAERAARRALDADGASAEPALVLGAARLALGRRQAAAEAFREALRRDPANTRAAQSLRDL